MTNRWDTALYDEKHAFVWKYGEELLELLVPQPGERILDLGSGTGHLTAQIAAAGAEVIGLDAAPSMVEQARHNYAELEFILGDAAAFSFEENFDAVFSNATLHWVRQADAAAACIACALKPGGRFVAEFGGRGNVGAVVEATYASRQAAGLSSGSELNPWYFPDAAEYSALLEKQGLHVTYANLFDRPTPLEGGTRGLANWLEMFGSALFSDLTVEQRSAIVSEVESRLQPQCYRDETWVVDYRRLRIVALKD